MFRSEWQTLGCVLYSQSYKGDPTSCISSIKNQLTSPEQDSPAPDPTYSTHHLPTTASMSTPPTPKRTTNIIDLEIAELIESMNQTTLKISSKTSEIARLRAKASEFIEAGEHCDGAAVSQLNVEYVKVKKERSELQKERWRLAGRRDKLVYEKVAVERGVVHKLPNWW